MMKLDITVHPTFSEPKIEQEVKKEVKGKQWRFPWRIKMLASPKPPAAKKYQPPPPEVFKVYGPVDPATEFRADHLSRPTLRKVLENKISYAGNGIKYINIITKTIDKSWNSIYNYYRKRLRERQLKRLKRKMEKLKAKKPTGKELEKIESVRKERLDKLATPKKLFLPEKMPKKWKPLEELLATLEILAAPKVYKITHPRSIGKVASKALLYEITETILKLAQLPDRQKPQPQKTLPPGYVKPAALKAKCTPRLEKLAEPSFSMKEAKKHEEENDPWAISPNALKYKASARILELAKPIERD